MRTNLRDCRKSFELSDFAPSHKFLPGTLEFAIHTLVETRLDTSGFAQAKRRRQVSLLQNSPLTTIVILSGAKNLVFSEA